PGPTAPATAHPLALCENYVAAGDVVGVVQVPAGQTYRRWPFLVSIDVRTAAHAGAIVAFGDSITDGYGSTIGANHRWPNFLSPPARGSGAHPRGREGRIFGHGPSAGNRGANGFVAFGAGGARQAGSKIRHLSAGPQRHGAVSGDGHCRYRR